MNGCRVTLLDGKTLANEAEVLMAEAEAAGFNARLMGSVAIRIVCAPTFSDYDGLRRPPKDVDVVIGHRHTVPFAVFLKQRGWLADGDGLALSEGGKFTMRHVMTGVNLDVYGSRLRFNQELDVTDALEHQGPTLPVADLVLLKVQIDHKSDDDWRDLALLLATHAVTEVGTFQDGMIERDRLVRVLRSWRWRECVHVAARGLEEHLAVWPELGEELQTRTKASITMLRALASEGDTRVARFVSSMRLKLFGYSWPVETEM
jgi:hypothetical protein